MKFRILALSFLVVASMATLAYGQKETGPMPPATASAVPEPAPAPASPAPPTRRIRVGGNVQAANLVNQVQPVYPQIAKTAHVQGTVGLHAIISKDGSIQQLDYVSGPMLLMKAAMDAVKQWRYKPTLLNDEPIEVDTTIQVVFTLSDAPPTESQEIDPQFKADILHLFDVLHVQERTVEMGRTAFQSLRPALLASLPLTPNREKIVDAYQEKLISLLSTQEFTDRSVALYAKYLMDDDVKALADFYQTPAGQHFNAVSGQITAEGFQIGQDIAKGHIVNILQSLCKDYPELKGAASFCPSESPQNKGLLIAPDGARSGASKTGD